MSLLNFDNHNGKAPRSFKPLKLIFSIGVLAAFIGIGSTLAANINLNTGTPIEFGQGVAQTTSCDNEVILTPFSSFVNIEGADEFGFTGITLSKLDTTDQRDSSEGCAGKTFTIKVYDKNGTLLEASYSLTVGDGVFISPDGDTPNNGLNQTETSVTLLFDTPALVATDVYRITIESSATTQVTPAQYSLGDTGPGGGKVFYYSESGFNCGRNFSAVGSPARGQCHYLESAPAGWNNNGVAALDPIVTWSGNNTDAIGGTSSALGAGFRNTVAIIKQSGGGSTSNRAATLSRGYIAPNGISDWYLPSITELNELCKYVVGQQSGDLETSCTGAYGVWPPDGQAFQNETLFHWNSYYSSTESDLSTSDSFHTKIIYFVSGDGFDGLKSNPTAFRPIRSF
ncbi:MAG: hypothetical protein F2690_02945 [Actinobacteria bacterium]|uniref:Unannotated protein n=1 Tax=freshwater metagenome TaxID=449393 RepID=A0A6J7W321_9ZZZZ|nr:hypothetical protein [Actinomycetota bacterium]MSX71898.1 hypothetical protein [Actinomycetota bacterium]MSY69507.1 hypothetical protein [Actinomycetota bacterium]MTA75989.1 hypothetical protein [Actinomycetota bacterium]